MAFTETLISGEEGTIQINSLPVVSGQTYDFTVTRNIMEKSFVGQGWGNSLKGQRRASFSGSGSVSAEGYAALVTAMETGSVPVSVQIGTAAGSTDAGVWTGTFNVSNLATTVSGDGEWDWSMDFVSDGEVTYTAPGS